MNSFDVHYLIGNYYSWYAATAGTGYGVAARNDAPGSICPKGWQLPSIVSADGSSETKKTFDGLYTKYDGVDARKLPLGLVAGGYVDVDYDQGRAGEPTLGSVGLRGDYWSSTANYPNNGGAFYMQVGSSGVDTYLGTYDSNMYDGYFVRCVVR